MSVCRSLMCYVLLCEGDACNGIDAKWRSEKKSTRHETNVGTIKHFTHNFMFCFIFSPGELAPHSLYQQLLDFCQQISAGMTYLSKKAFVHRDIAARNILLSGKTCKACEYSVTAQQHV